MYCSDQCSTNTGESCMIGMVLLFYIIYSFVYAGGGKEEAG